MLSRAFRPIAATLSLLLLCGAPTHAAPVAISQVIQVIGGYQILQSFGSALFPKTQARSWPTEMALQRLHPPRNSHLPRAWPPFLTTPPETLLQPTPPTHCSRAWPSALIRKQVLRSSIRETLKEQYATVVRSQCRAAASRSGRYCSWPRFHSSSFTVAIIARRPRRQLHRRLLGLLKFRNRHRCCYSVRVLRLSGLACAGVMPGANWPRKSKLRRRPNQNA